MGYKEITDGYNRLQTHLNHFSLEQRQADWWKMGFLLREVASHLVLKADEMQASYPNMHLDFLLNFKVKHELCETARGISPGVLLHVWLEYKGQRLCDTEEAPENIRREIQIPADPNLEKVLSRLSTDVVPKLQGLLREHLEQLRQWLNGGNKWGKLPIEMTITETRRGSIFNPLVYGEGIQEGQRYGIELNAGSHCLAARYGSEAGNNKALAKPALGISFVIPLDLSPYIQELTLIVKNEQGLWGMARVAVRDVRPTAPVQTPAAPMDRPIPPVLEQVSDSELRAVADSPQTIDVREPAWERVSRPEPPVTEKSAPAQIRKEQRETLSVRTPSITEETAAATKPADSGVAEEPEWWRRNILGKRIRNLPERAKDAEAIAAEEPARTGEAAENSKAAAEIPAEPAKDSA